MKFIIVGDTVILDEAFASAFRMATRASEAIGDAAPSDSPDLWLFPDSEGKDLAARIFGGVSQTDLKGNKNKDLRLPLPHRLKIVKSKWNIFVSHSQFR